MRLDWVPVSAASLIAGVSALSLGSLLLPRADGVAETLRLVQQNDGRWLAVAVVFFVAAVAMLLGLPALLTLFQHRAPRLGVAALGLFAVGCMGVGGYAMLLSFFRALVIHDAVDTSTFPDVLDDTGLQVLLTAWLIAFYVGELLLAVALFVARTTPTWVPAALLAHVALMLLGRVAPDVDLRWAIVLLALSLVGAAIAAAGQAEGSPAPAVV